MRSPQQHSSLWPHRQKYSASSGSTPRTRLQIGKEGRREGGRRERVREAFIITTTTIIIITDRTRAATFRQFIIHLAEWFEYGNYFSVSHDLRSFSLIYKLAFL